ncbi:MAG: exodeoxyribonuclease V subunit alpha [Desulfoarculaceae bacterium]|nr:exodeoxyribonuclease V subunit alpha [Desulfoarculaceae bacterium]
MDKVALPPGRSLERAIFSPLDQQFARFMARKSGLTGTASDRFELLINRLSAALADGHSCLPLTSEEEQLLSGIDTALISREITTPLVLWHNRLYLQRYFRYELRLAGQIKAMAQAHYAVPECRAELDACFGQMPETDAEIDWQRLAAEMALKRPLALISGGPGTGKTSTVARILGLLLLTLGPDLQIALAAPTGKAAMRLRESIAASLASLPFSDMIKGKIPTSASTLHRLLGVRHHSPCFRHTHANPLPWDVVVVDEASMVDLAMMSKLVDALKPGARLILLGDKDQLASVESGAILADCIQALPDNTVTLRKSYRFNQEISAFARAVNENDSAAAWARLNDKSQETATVTLLHEPVTDFISARYSPYMRKAQALQSESNDDIRQLFQCFNQFRVLCATRRGPGGVEALNRQVEQNLTAQGYPSLAGGRPSSIPGAGDTGASLPGAWYPGRPVMILNNDYNLNLFNGDIGICLPDLAAATTKGPGPKFKIWFEREDGSLKGYQPYRLPPCETVFAMTIHKGQGSEFGEVLVVLPTTDTPLLTRELIYTAITRAKTKVVIAGDQAIFNAAVNRSIHRSSGLHAMLMGSK